MFTIFDHFVLLKLISLKNLILKYLSSYKIGIIKILLVDKCLTCGSIHYIPAFQPGQILE